VKAVADALGVARSNLAVQANAAMPARRRGHPAKPATELLAEIKQIIAGQPSYGYRRVHALIRRCRREERGAAVNVKRVYRIMKAHGLLLERHTGTGGERRHDGRVAVDRPDTRWCSDAFEIGCDNGERVRIAFTLDCCDREAIAWVATTGGIDSSDVRDLMVESVERRFGLVNRSTGCRSQSSGCRTTARLIPHARPGRWPARSAWSRARRRSKARSPTAASNTTTAHRNTHLSMSMKEIDFVDRDAIPRGASGSAAPVPLWFGLPGWRDRRG
jgi:transposase InsO family protein